MVCNHLAITLSQELSQEQERHTNKWGAITVGELIAHELLSVDATILIACTRRCRNRLVHLEVDERTGSRGLTGPEVREPQGECLLDARCEKDIHAQKRGAVDGSSRHFAQGLPARSVT